MQDVYANLIMKVRKGYNNGHDPHPRMQQKRI